jgi:hypothetical protein
LQPAVGFDLAQYLKEIHSQLESLAVPLCEAGIEKEEHLALVEEADIDVFGVPLFAKRALMTRIKTVAAAFRVGYHRL